MEQPTSASAMVELLTPIWQRALHRPHVNAEEDFFELGGDPAAAAYIFAEIAQAGGPRLPSFRIYQAPTIASLAALLLQKNVPEFPPAVRMKPGTSDHPVFITHGLGASLMELFDLVRQITPARPIYGLQTRGMDGAGEPFDRIENMAMYFLEVVKMIQRQGPYTLIGYSLGGLVMMELAGLLRESGEKIALLAMIDSYPPRDALTFPQRARLDARIAIGRLIGKNRPQSSNAGKKDYHDTELPELDSSSPAVKRVRESSALALNRYRPRFYAGEIHFVRAAIPTIFPANPVPVWSRHVKEFAVESVPGDHHGILKAHSRELAFVVSRNLEDTQA